MASSNEDALYTVHDYIKVKFENGHDNELYKSNKSIESIVQKHVPLPALSELITAVTAQNLYATGEFVFDAKNENIFGQQKSGAGRICAAWNGGHSDSNGIYIKVWITNKGRHPAQSASQLSNSTRRDLLQHYWK
ncbi:hypothetical protein BGZ81_000751 [Podila clonocystis]|nr:hypothetical protein BGZ81_000751 [Podila clonocystis]